MSDRVKPFIRFRDPGNKLHVSDVLPDGAVQLMTKHQSTKR